MTEPENPPPHDPAPMPPLEQRAVPEIPPIELPSCVGEPLAAPEPRPASQPVPPPVPPLAPAAVVVSAAAVPPPPVPPHQPFPAAPLPPLYTPPPSEPRPVPFEPEPPMQPPVQPPPPPPGAPPHYGSPEPGPGESPRPSFEGWAMAAHLSGVLTLGFAWLLFGFVGPLIIWLAKKDDDPEIDWHGREALNFQLNLLLFWLAGLPLLLVCCLGLVLWAILPFYGIVLGLIATIKAADGKRFRYPFTLRLLND